MGGKVCNSAAVAGAGGSGGRVSEIKRPCVGTKYLARQEESVSGTAAFLPLAEVLSQYQTGKSPSQDVDQERLSLLRFTKSLQLQMKMMN